MERMNKTIYKHTNLYSILKVVLTLLFVGGTLGSTLYAKNEDTPNLDFSKGTWEGWTRYYGYYGPINMFTPTNGNVVSNSLDAKDVDATDIWTLKDDQISGTSFGMFEIVSSSSNDNNLACDNLKLVPEGSTHSARLGNMGNPEIYPTTNIAKGWYRRAMAERMTYSFVVTENSTLLTYKYAAIIQKDSEYDSYHDENEMKPFTVTITSNGNELCNSVKIEEDSDLEKASTQQQTGTYQTVCVEYGKCNEYSSTKYYFNKNLSNGVVQYYYMNGNRKRTFNDTENAMVYDEEKKHYKLCTKRECSVTDKIFIPDDKVYPCYQSNLTQEILGEMYYKAWTTITYDLRDYIGQTVTIDVQNRDCLERDWVCESCNQYGTLSNVTPSSDVRGRAQCAKCNATRYVNKYTMAGFHRTYGYFTAETSKMELTVQNCGDGSDAKITAPEGFASYEWKDPYGNTLDTEDGHPNVALVSENNIKPNQDYTCTMRSADPDCEPIVEKFRLNNPPINIDFTADVACYNEVQFTDKTEILPVTIDGEEVIYDSIVNRVWSYEEGGKTIEIAETSPLIQFNCENNSSCTYEVKLTIWTANDCKRETTKVVTVKPRPEVKLTGEETLCFGLSTPIQLSNYIFDDNTYFWLNETGDTLSQGSGESYRTYMAKPTNGTATYTLRIERKEKTLLNNERTCRYIGDHSITVKETPTVTATANNVRFPIIDGVAVKAIDICAKAPAKINATTNMDCDIRWFEDPAVTLKESNKTNLSDFEYKPEQDTKIYVEATSTNGCKAYDSIYIDTLSIPNIEIDGPEEICSNVTQKYIATGDGKPDSYVWTTAEGSNFQMPEISVSIPEAEGVNSKKYTYTLLGVGNNGCSNTITKEITVHNPPTLNVEGSTQICEDGEISLSVSGADSCNWDNQKITKENEIMTDTPEITRKSYVVYGYKKHTTAICQTQREIPITIHSKPNVTISGITDICEGGSVTLNASGATRYKWEENSGANSASITVTPTADTTIYHVIGYTDITTITPTLSCESNAEVTVVVHGEPQFSLSAEPEEVCEGDQTTITPTAQEGYEITSYQWDNGALNNTLTTNVYTTQEFGVTATDRYGCTSHQAIEIKTKPYPTLTISNNGPICENSTGTIYVEGADEYSWIHGEESGTVQGVTNQKGQFTHEPKGTGLVFYQVTGTTKGCSTIEQTAIEISEAPALAITGYENGVCVGGSVTLTASGGAAGKTYSWSGDISDTIISGNLNQKISIDANKAGKYNFKVVGADAKGCPGIASITLEVYENPTIVITKDDENSYCEGTNVKLSAEAPNTNIFNWTLKDEDNNSLGDASGANINLPLQENTLFIVEGTDINTCKGRDSILLKTKPYPTFNIEGENYICSGSNITLTANGTIGTQYQWERNGQTTTGEEFTDTPDYSTLGSNYNIDITGTLDGCELKKNFSLDVITPPNIFISGNNVYCEGETVELTAKGGVSGEYVWEDNSKKNTFTTTATPSQTTFKVKGQDNKGCVNEATFNITIKSAPNVEIVEPQTTAICKESTIKLEVKGATTYTWEEVIDEESNEYSCTNCASINPQINSDVTYIVTGKDGEGCTNTDTIKVTMKEIPEIEITGENVVCMGTDVTLTAQNKNEKTTITNWEWSESDTDNKNETLIIENVISKKSYTVTAKSDAGCEKQASKEIDVYTPQTIGIDNGKGYICEGGSITVNAIGDSNLEYTWKRSDDANWEKTGTSITLTDINNNINISLSAEDGNGCKTSADTKTIEKYANPIVTISADNNGNLCEGGSIKLTAKGNTSMRQSEWIWYDEEKNDINNKVSTLQLNNITESTIYYVKGVDVYGCESNLESYTISPQTTPKGTIVGLDTICKNNEITLHVETDANNSIEWNTGETTNNITQTLTIAKEYTFTATLNNGACSNTITKKVVVNDNPKVTLTSVSGKSSVCEDESIQLKAEGSENVTYQWKDSESTTNIAEFKPTSGATSIKCEVTVTENSTNCSSSANFNVTVNTKPVLYINEVINGDSSVCEGEVITLKASGLSTKNYDWYVDNAIVGGSENYNPNVLKETVFSVKGVDENGCQGETNFTVKTKPYPTFEVKNSTICSGEEAEVKITNGNAEHYTWKWGNEEYVGKEGETIYKERLSTSKVYTIFGTLNGCKTPEGKNVTVTVKSLPTIAIESNPLSKEICLNESVILNALGGENGKYKWSAGEGLIASENIDQVIATPTQKGTFTYQVIGEKDGCSNQANINITVNPLPEVEIESQNTSVCIGESITLTGNGATNYTWSTGTSTWNGASISPIINESTNFTLTGTDGKGCQSKPKEITISTKEKPTVSWEKVEVCEGGDAKVVIEGADNITWKYDGTTTGNERTFTNVTEEKTYQITVSKNDCSKDTFITIYVNKLPTISLTNNLGEKNGVCIGNEVSIKASADNCEFRWKTGGDNVTLSGNNNETLSFRPKTSGTKEYYVVAQNKTTQCIDSVNYIYNVYDNPTNTITGTGITCINSTVRLESEKKNFVNYSWAESSNKQYIINTQSEVEVAIDSDKEYQLVVTDQNGCTDTSLYEVRAIAYPTFEFKYDTICSGEKGKIELTNIVPNDAKVNWSWNGGLLANESSIIEQTLNGDTEFTASVYTSIDEVNKCETNKVFTAAVHPTPNFTIQSNRDNDEICEKETITLTASDASYSYQWKVGEQIVAEDEQSVTKAPSENTTYNVIASNAKGCTTTLKKEVIVNKLPELSIETTGAACPGNTITIKVSGSDDIEWLNSEKISIGNKTNDLSVKIEDGGNKDTTFYVVGKSSKGCSVTENVQITKLTKPNLIFSGKTVICENNIPKISVSGASTYSWYNGDNLIGKGTELPETQPLTESKTYKVIGEDGVNCSAEAFVTITVNKTPEVYITASNTDNISKTNICLGETVKLTAHADNVTFEDWENGELIVTGNEVGNKTYTIQVTEKSTQCPGSAKYDVNTLALPGVKIISNESEVCEGYTITLSSNDEYSSYQWYTLEGNNKININSNISSWTQTLNATTKFILDVTDGNSCKNSDTTEIVAKKYPIVTFEAPAVCSGTPGVIKVTASDADTYSWPNNGSNSENIWTSNDNLTNPKSFTITVGKAECYKTHSINIGIKEKPNLAILVNGENTNGNSVEVCSNNNTVVLNVTSDNKTLNTYNWTVTENSVSTNKSYTTNPTEKTTYKITAIDTEGCANEKEQTIVVNTPATITIEGDKSVCEDGNVTLTASGSKNYSWSVSPTDGANIRYNNDEKSNVTLQGIRKNITLTINGIDNNGCANEKVTHSISVINKPALTITSNNGKMELCSGENLTLNATATNATIKWKNNEEEGSSFTTPTLNTSEKKTYSYDVNYYYGESGTCSADTTVSIIVNPLPIVQITGDIAFCDGGKTTLTASEMYGNTNMTYKWDGNTEKTNSIEVNQTGTYKVIGTDDVTGCQSAEKTYNVTRYDNPTGVTISAAEATCKDSLITLTATGISQMEYEWYRVGENNNDVHIGNGRSIEQLISENVQFKIEVAEPHTQSNGQILRCYDTISYNVTAIDAPEFHFTGESVCYGENAEIKINGSADAEYTWNNLNHIGTNYTEKEMKSNKTYSVTATQNGCSRTKDTTLTIHALPIINSITAEESVCLDSKITINSDCMGNGNLTYNWTTDNNDPSSIVGASNRSTLDVTPTKEGDRIYTLEITDENDCKNSSSITIGTKNLPIINISGNTTVCYNSDISLKVGNNLTFNWYEYDVTTAKKGDLLMSGNGNEPFVQTIQKDQSFYLEVENDEGCTQSKVVDVKVLTLPEIKWTGKDTICIGDETEITFVATKSGDKYSLFDEEKNTYKEVLKESFSPTTTTTYKIQVESENNCINEKELEIVVNALPEITINNVKDGSSSICLNSEITLEAGSNTNCDFEWSTGSTADEIIVKASTIEGYSAKLTGTDVNGCKNSTNYNVIGIALPSIELSGDKEVCNNKEAYVSVKDTKGYNYLWEDNNSTESERKVTITKDTTLVVTFTDPATQCSNKDSIKVMNIDYPTLKLSTENITVCLGESVTIKAETNATMVNWTGIPTSNKEYTTIVDNSKKLNVKANNNGCETSKEVTINYYNLPSVTIATSGIVCENQKGTLNAEANGGQEPYNYLWNDESKEELLTTKNLTIADNNSEYSVEVSDKNGCKATATATIQVAPNPVITIEAEEQSICNGENVKLTANGAGDEGSYIWNTNEEGSVITPTIENDMTFHVTGTDLNGCEGVSDELLITKKELPELEVSGELTICYGDSTIITLSAAGTGEAKFYWTEDTEIGQYTEKIESAKRTLKPTTRTNYKVIIEQNGCSKEEEITINVNTLPEIRISSTQAENTICLGEKITLTATNGLTNYQWMDKSNNSESGTSNQVIVTPIKQTEYKVSAQDGNGCINSDSIVVIVNQKPEIQLESADAACINSSLVLNVQNADGYPSAKQYNWVTLGVNNSSSTMTTNHSANTTYQVIATAQNGCTDTAEHYVEVIELPVFSLKNNSPICFGEKVEIGINTSNDNYTYTWPSNGTTTGEEWVESNVHEASVTEYEYNVRGTITKVIKENSYECYSDVKTSVKVNELPTVKLLGTTFVCPEDATINLSAQGSNKTTFAWSAKENSGSIAGNGATAVASPSDAEILVYYVEGTNENSCKNRDSISIQKANEPQFEMESDSVGVCIGGEIELSLSTGDKYVESVSWSWNGGTSKNNSVKITNVNSRMVVKATATAEKGCTATKDFILKPVEYPDLEIEGSDYVCKNDTATINLSNAEQIVWGNTYYANEATINEPLKENKTYTFVAINSDTINGKITTCKNDKDYTVVVRNLPIITLEKFDSICQGDLITIKANVQQEAAPYTYYWGKNETGQSIESKPQQDTLFKVVVKDANNCVDSMECDVIVNPAPIFNVAPVIVCDGTRAIINSDNNNYTYQWEGTGDFSNLTSHTTSFEVTRDTSVVVIAKDDKGCRKQEFAEIRRKPNPKLQISGRNTICQNDTVHLSVKDLETEGGTTTYIWNNNSTENKSIFISNKIDEYKEFTVQGTKDGCITSATYQINVNNLPTIEILGDNQVCENGSIALKGEGGIQYRWNNEEYPSDATNANEEYQYSADASNTLITIEGRDINGCINTSTINIAILQLPKFNITGDTIACNNSKIRLEVPGDVNSNKMTYEWKNEEEEVIASENYADVEIKKDTKLKVTGINIEGCSFTDSITIKVKQAPKVEIADYSPYVCRGENGIIQLIDNADKFTWTDYNGNLLSENEKVEASIESNNTRFNVTLTNEYPIYKSKISCETDTTFIVNMWDLPQVKIDGSKAICAGEEVELTATEGLTYEWINTTKNDTLSNSEKKLKDKPSITTTYKVIATDGNQCENETDFTVIVNSLPDFELINNDEEVVCVGNEVNIKTNNQNYLYNWDGNGYLSQYNHTYTVDSEIEIVVYAMNNQTKCENSDTIKVGVKEFPTLSIDAPAYVCSGSTATITGKIDGVNYTWREEDENGKILSTDKSVTIDEIESDKQIYASVEKNGCTSDTTFIIRTWSLPNIKIEGSPATSICKNDSITLTAQGGTAYKWNNDDSQTSNTYKTPKLTSETKIKVWGEDGNQCANSDSITIYINELPEFDIIGNDVICIGGKAELNTTNDGLSYIWKDKTGKEVSVQQYFTPTITKDTLFQVIGINALGCSNTQEHTITVNPYPVITTVLDSTVVCKGASAYIEVETDIESEYIWNNDKTQTGNSISKEIQNRTEFVVKATSKDGGCTSEMSYWVDVRELPTILAEDATICKNEKATLNASGTNISEYRWMTSGNSTTLNTGDQYTTPELATTTSYIVIGKDNFGCEGSKEVVVRINELPTFTLTNEASVCKNSETTIEASNPTLKYNWGGGYKTDLTNRLVIEKDTTITIIAMDDNGCVSEGSTTIKVKELPVLKFELANDYVCPEEDLTIKVSGAIDGYKWMDNSTKDYLTLKNIENNIEVSVEGTTNGCTSSIDTTINVWELPNIRIGSATEDVCIGNSMEIYGEGAGVGGRYIWDDNRTTDTITVSPTFEKASFSVIGIDANGCKNSYTFDANIHELPIITIEGENEICRGENAELSASGTSEYYVWTMENEGKTDTLSMTSILRTAIDKDEIKFFVEGTDRYGCIALESYEVKAKEFPTLTYRTNTAKDSVCKNGTIKIEVDGADSYLWQDGSTKTFVEEKLSNPAKYTIEGTRNGCTSKMTVNIGIWQLPEFNIEGENAVCAGGEIVLNAVPTIAGNRYSYTWENMDETSETITQKLETPNSTITYKAIAKDANQCQNYDVHTVKVNPLPTDIVISGETLICVGTETTLTASGSAIEYLWSNGTSSNEVTATIEKDSLFTVTGTDMNGCQYTTDIEVKVKEYPALNIEYPRYVCIGDSATIIVSGATSFIWEDTKDNNPIRKEKIESDTKFVIEGTTNGCTTREEFTISVWSLPSIWISTNDVDNEICNTESITLSAGGGVSGKYVWNNDSQQTSDEITVSPSENTIYTLVGEDENGCRNSGEFEVIVNELPTVEIEGTPLICAGDNVTLSANTTGNAIKTFVWSNGAADSEIEVAVKENTQFKVEVEDVNGCKAETTYNVETKPYPELTYTAPNHICIGNNVAVTVSGATTYEWIDAPQISGNNFVDTPKNDTLYKVRGTTNGCTSYLEIPMTVMPLPEIWISSASNEICKNTTLQLTANGGASYQWNTNASSQSITISPNATTEYKVIGTDSYGCINDTSITIVVNELPEVKIFGETQICEGNSTTLWVEGDATRYTWTNTGEQSDTIYPVINKSTTFTVLAENVAGCTATATKTVASKPYPVLNYSAPATICEGEEMNIIVNGAEEYKWQDGSTSNTYSATLYSNSTFTVIGTSNGCSTTENFTVNVLPLPYIWITGTSDICLNDKVTLDVKGASTYKWSTGDETNSITTTPQDTTTYKVVGTDVNGCSSETEFTVKVHPLPILQISGEDAICYGESAELTASGNAKEYRWSTGQESMNIHPMITKTETFKLIGIDEFGCTNETSKEVTMKPNPILVFNAAKTVCYGSQARIIVSGADEYRWQDGSTGNEYIDTPENRTTYSVVGTTNGCTTEEKFQVDVLSLPSIWITGSLEICENDGVKLSASGGLSYEWNTGLKASELYANPKETTTYEVVGKDGNGCMNKQTYTVVVNPLPEFTIEGPNAVCKGEIAELNVNGDNYKYAWSTGAITANISPIVNENTIFTVEAINSYGCSAKKNHTVVSKPYPTLIYNGPKVVCAGEKVQLIVVGATNYQWGDSVSGNRLTIVPETNTTYSVKGETNGCYTEMSIPIDVLQKPTLTYQGNTTLCEGELLSLTVHGANSYSWNNGNNSNKIESYVRKSNQYIVTGKDEKGCTNKLTIDVTVNPEPKFNIIGDDVVCRGHNAKLTAVGDAETYLWGYGNSDLDDNVSSNNETVYVPISTSTYVFVEGRSSNGCPSRQYKTITTKESPNIVIEGNTEICLGDTIRLKGLGGESYVWKINNKEVGNTNTLEYEPTGNARIVLEGTLNECTTETEVYVKTHVPPTLMIDSDPKEICSGENASLRVKGAKYYHWSTGDTTPSISPRLTSNETFTVTGTSTNGCTSTKTVSINVHELPRIKINLDSISGCFKEDKRTYLSALGGVEYKWESTPPYNEVNNQIGNLLEFYADRNYTIIVTGEDENGCRNKDSMLIIPEEDVVLKYAITPKVVEESNPIIQLEALSHTASQYTWTWEPQPQMYAKDDETKVGPKHTYTIKDVKNKSEVIYDITVTEGGCKYVGQDTVFVWKEFWAPNAFTPNKDGINDYFRFDGMEYVTEFTFTIFDRTGRVVYEGSHPEDKWDGTFNGQECPWGVYGWVANYVSDYKNIHKEGTRKGEITLIR